MKRAVLNKIFVGKIGAGKFLVSGLAFVAGLALVLLALQGYIRIGEYLKPAGGRSNFVIINKEVVMANTILGSHAQFSTDEINKLQRQPFVEDMATFRSNNYEVVAHAGGEMGLYTELFFESVPRRFIDAPTAGFTWEEGDDFVPIIISQDFLDLYNFGFALGKGSRQLSRSSIQLVPVDLQIAGQRGKRNFKGRVVGFSDRIPSVLVPEEFLKWSNDNIGNPEETKASRVILKLRENGSSQLSSYLEKNHLAVSDEKLKFGKILSALNILTIAVLAIGMGFIVFSLVIVMLNFSLMVSQASDEVSLLLQLGYSRQQIVAHLAGYLVFFITAVSVLTFGVLMVGNRSLTGLLETAGVAINRSLAAQTIISGLCCIVIFFVFSYTMIGRLIGRHHKQ